MYYLYILKCSDNTYYTGITTDLYKRLDEHNNKKTGARYTKMRRPLELVYSKKHKNRSEASKEEYRIKKLSREEKIKIINTYNEKSIGK